MLASHQRSLRAWPRSSRPAYTMGSSEILGIRSLCSRKCSSSKGRNSSAGRFLPFSNTTTFHPRWVSTWAAVPPPAPLPTIIASGFSILPGIRLAPVSDLRARKVVGGLQIAEPSPHHLVGVAAPPRIGEAAFNAVRPQSREEFFGIHVGRHSWQCPLRQLLQQRAHLLG